MKLSAAILLAFTFISSAPVSAEEIKNLYLIDSFREVLGMPTVVSTTHYEIKIKNDSKRGISFDVPFIDVNGQKVDVRRFWRDRRPVRNNCLLIRANTYSDGEEHHAAIRSCKTKS